MRFLSLIRPVRQTRTPHTLPLQTSCSSCAPPSPHEAIAVGSTHTQATPPAFPPSSTTSVTLEPSLSTKLLFFTTCECDFRMWLRLPWLGSFACSMAERRSASLSDFSDVSHLFRAGAGLPFAQTTAHNQRLPILIYFRKKMIEISPQECLQLFDKSIHMNKFNA